MVLAWSKCSSIKGENLTRSHDTAPHPTPCPRHEPGAQSPRQDGGELRPALGGLTLPRPSAARHAHGLASCTPAAVVLPSRRHAKPVAYAVCLEPGLLRGRSRHARGSPASLGDQLPRLPPRLAEDGTRVERRPAHGRQPTPPAGGLRGATSPGQASATQHWPERLTGTVSAPRLLQRARRAAGPLRASAQTWPDGPGYEHCQARATC